MYKKKRGALRGIGLFFSKGERILELDRLCFGGLWTSEGYQRELDSDCSDLLGLFLYPLSPSGAGILPASSPNPSLLGIGCLWAILEEAHITILGIDPEYRNCGLGQAMLVGLMTSALGRKLERATLEVRVSNRHLQKSGSRAGRMPAPHRFLEMSNVAAISLYEKYGFKKAGCRKGYYQDNGEDGLILWRGGLHHREFPEILRGWQQEVNERLGKNGRFLEYDK